MDDECLRSIQESTTLAEHFQNIVDDCKVSCKSNDLSSIFVIIFSPTPVFAKLFGRDKVQKMHFRASDCQIKTEAIFLKCTIWCQNHIKVTFLGSTSSYWRLHRKKFQAWESNQSHNIGIFGFHRKLAENWAQCFKHKR